MHTIPSGFDSIKTSTSDANMSNGRSLESSLRGSVILMNAVR